MNSRSLEGTATEPFLHIGKHAVLQHASTPALTSQGGDSRDLSKASQKKFGTAGPSTPMARFDKDGNDFDVNDVRARASQNTTSKIASSLLVGVRPDFGSRTNSVPGRLQRSDSSPNMNRFHRPRVRIQERKSEDSWTRSVQSSSMFSTNGRHTKSEDHPGRNSGHKPKHRSKKHKHKDHKKKKKKKRLSQHKSNENDLKNSAGVRAQQKIEIITGDRERSTSDIVLENLKRASSAFSRSMNDVKSPKFGGRLSRTFNHDRLTNSGSMFSRSLNDLDRSSLSVDIHRKATSSGSSTKALPLSPAPLSRVDTKSKASPQSHRNKKPREKLPVLNPRDLAKPLGQCNARVWHGFCRTIH